MDENYTGQPNEIKIKEFDDVMNYAIKYDKKIDIEFINKHGYTKPESKWIMREYRNHIDQHNVRVLTKQNLELRRKILDLEISIKYNNNKNNVSSVTIDCSNVDNYSIITKNKGKVSRRNVSSENVNNLWKVLKYLMFETKDNIEYKDVVARLIQLYKLNIDIASFNGGSNRKFMFKYYYYPITILKNLGFVEIMKKKIYIKNIKEADDMFK